MLSNGKWTTYLAYAIGEIILVVVGILIAVRIDDWNAQRNERENERKILLEIKRDLQTNLKEINDHLDFQIESLMLTKALYKKLNAGICNDSTSFYFLLGCHHKQFYPKTSGYEALKSAGLNIISNDSLRKSISDIYELTFPDVIKRGVYENRIDNPMIMADALTRKYIDLTRGADVSVPISDTLQYFQKLPTISSCEDFLNDREVIFLITGILAARGDFIYSFEDAARSTENLIENINQHYSNYE